jgi:predicted nucleic acid-binding protein
MILVTDASVIVRGLEVDGAARRFLLEDEIQIPHLADSEIAHALRAQVKRGRVSGEDALSRLREWQRLGVARYPSVMLLPRVWDLRDSLSAYDATYVALAEALECPLATADLRLTRAPGPRCEIIATLS